MRFTSIPVAIALIFFSSIAFAGSVDDLKKNIVLDQKKLAVLENLTLSDEESAKFWPLFRDFQEASYDLEEKQIDMILFYIKNHKSLTDEQASNLINLYFLTADNRRKLLRDFAFVLEFEKVLPAKKIFRFLQVQQNIEAIEQNEISKKVPLLE
jgi:hypothetical protein